MTLHPAAPEDFPALVDAWAHTTRAVLDLGHSLRPGDVDLPTDCPGWTVFDQVAHVASLESMVAGEAEPDADVSGRGYVHGQFATTVERYLEPRRGRSLEAVLQELEWLLAAGTQRYRDPELDPQTAAETPLGAGTVESLVSRRTFDVWCHEQDIREAIGRIGNLDSAAAALSVSQVFQALPRLVVKQAGIEPGHAVIIDLTGPTTGRVGVRVEARDDGPRGVQLFSGDPEEHGEAEPHETTSISLSTQAFMRRAAGRKGTDEIHWKSTGDETVARRVLDALAVTP